MHRVPAQADQTRTTGVKLVTSDAHEGIKAAASKVFCATWQRCRVHFMRNGLVHAGKTQRRIVSAFVGPAFAQDDKTSAKTQWRQHKHAPITDYFPP